MFTFINSPLDQFEIQLLIGFQLPFININNFNISTFTIFSLILLLVVLFLYLLPNNNIIGSKWIVFHEVVYDTIMNMLKNIIQSETSKDNKGPNSGAVGVPPVAGMFYFPLIYTFFVFIMLANLLSLIPYTFSLTSNFMFIISLSFVVWLGITILGLYQHGLVFFSLFIPHNTPLILVPLLVIIEILSYVARAISLGLRLSVNNLCWSFIIKYFKWFII